jgi:uncharacterized protein (DUF427 family)
MEAVRGRVRVDSSGRRLSASLGGSLVADSIWPVLVWEDRSIEPPAVIHLDNAWVSRSPLPEARRISGLMNFHDERDDMHVDDVLQERPRSRAG